MTSPRFLAALLPLAFAGAALTGCTLFGDGVADAAEDAAPLDSLQTCAQIADAFQAERTAIQSCRRDADCGQVLEGTSCGCTRNWVAREEAEADRFYQILDLGLARQCDLPVGSTCDCPPADGFACVENRCTWNYTSGS